jgi:hypothetical protein
LCGAWADEVFAVNVDMDAVVVKTGAGQWQVAKPCIDVSRLAVSSLMKALAYAAQGLLRENLISELVPMENIVLEPLHLLL